MTTSSLLTPLGEVVVSPRGEARVLSGHPWVYASDVARTATEEAGIVLLRGPERPLGWALYSPRSTIAVRHLSADQPVTRDLLTARLRAAHAARRALGDTHRLVHGEADLMPGTFVDRYGDVLAVQSLCAAADRIEPVIVELLVDLLAPRAVVLRNNAAVRRKEELPLHVTVAHGSAPVLATYREGDIAYELDLESGHKTGSFLDQVYNHVAAGTYAFGQGLDCFTYQGGFALQMARRCEHVVAIDQSAPALERGAAHAAANGVANVEWVRAEVLQWLTQASAAGRQFDTIVLDPPAFAGRQSTVRKALGGYREINRRAMGMLRPGGVLVSCSCSGRVGAADFDDMLRRSAKDAGRRVQILERRGAGPDHPVLLGVPETEYLECRIARVM